MNWEKFGSAGLGFSKIHHSYELEKTWKYTYTWAVYIHSSRSTFQNPHFESMNKLGKNMS